MYCLTRQGLHLAYQTLLLKIEEQLFKGSYGLSACLIMWGHVIKYGIRYLNLAIHYLAIFACDEISAY